MSVTIPLEQALAARLRERATAAGEDLDAFVARLVAQFGALPTSMETLSGPLATRFTASGDSEQQLIDEIEAAKHAMRAARRVRG